MSRADLHADMADAMVSVVLQRVENCVKALRCDTSATAPEHVIGWEAGYKQAKRDILDLFADFI